MATVNYKNSIYKSITEKSTIPFNVTGTGVAITNGIGVVGTGTKFKSEMPAGSWIVDLANDELRRVVKCESDTEAYLDYSFSTDLSSGALEIVPQKSTSICVLSIEAVDGDCFIDGETFPEGKIVTGSKDGRDGNSLKDFIDPFIIDPDGNSMLIFMLR